MTISRAISASAGGNLLAIPARTRRHDTPDADSTHRSARRRGRWKPAKGFRRLKAYEQLSMLRAALIARSEQTSNQLHGRTLDEQLKVA
jgi:hypothetical protein